MHKVSIRVKPQIILAYKHCPSVVKSSVVLFFRFYSHRESVELSYRIVN
ncbi:hypothetical protein LJPFL01_0104 [Lelliottia jeotgali]|nr:hypothetical protein LJPFL01_0104 [Lelliottia jeotgali]